MHCTAWNAGRTGWKREVWRWRMAQTVVETTPSKEQVDEVQMKKDGGC
jgi:hypothetical protein